MELRRERKQSLNVREQEAELETEGYKMLRPRQPNVNCPQFDKRKPRPRQPSDKLKVERSGKREGYITLLIIMQSKGVASSS